MAHYAPSFPGKWREVLSHPEMNLDNEHLGFLVNLLKLKESPSGKGKVYMPALLFSEQIQCHAMRDMIPPAAATKRAMWGSYNIRELILSSPRSMYWMNRLVRETGIGCRAMEVI